MAEKKSVARTTKLMTHVLIVCGCLDYEHGGISVNSCLVCHGARCFFDSETRYSKRVGDALDVSHFGSGVVVKDEDMLIGLCWHNRKRRIVCIVVLNYWMRKSIWECASWQIWQRGMGKEKIKWWRELSHAFVWLCLGLALNKRSYKIGLSSCQRSNSKMQTQVNTIFWLGHNLLLLFSAKTPSFAAKLLLYVASFDVRSRGTYPHGG